MVVTTGDHAEEGSSRGWQSNKLQGLGSCPPSPKLLPGSGPLLEREIDFYLVADTVVRGSL